MAGFSKTTLPEVKEALEAFLNEHSLENGSDTPDFILAEFLLRCLQNYESAVNQRDQWHGRGNEQPATAPEDPSPTFDGSPIPWDQVDGRT